MKEIIEQIEKLSREIPTLESFLETLEKGNTVSVYSTSKLQKTNKFYRFIIEMNEWTGSDTCFRERKVNDEDTMNELAKVMAPIIRLKLQAKKLKLASLINLDSDQKLV